MKAAVIVRFKREAKGEWETGVGFTKQAGTQSLAGLLDSEGKSVVPYDFTITYIFGCMLVPENIK